MSQLLRAGIININTNHPTYSSLEKTLSLIYENRNKLDIIIGPEWGLMENNDLWNEYPLESSNFGKLIECIREISSDSDALIIPGTAVISTRAKMMYNILPVFYRGKIVFSTIKRNDGGTSFFGNDEYKLIGEDYLIEDTFMWKNLKIGIEICADSGTLYREGKRDLDIQILSSSGIRDTKLVVRQNGYLICSDGNPKAGLKNYIIKTKSAEYGINPINYINFFKSYCKQKNLKNPLFDLLGPSEKHKNIVIYKIEI